MAWIAVDAGTSVIKAVAFRKNGEEIALARARTEVLHPQPGFAEQSMESVWAQTLQAVQHVVKAMAEPVEGIAITAQGDGCWLVNANGEPTGNAILWNDGRATAEVENATATGAIENGFRISGSVGYPGLSNAILSWLRAHEPGRLDGAKWVLSCNGWLFSRFTGNFIADLSDASNPFGDVARGTYSDDLFKLYGEPASELFPVIAKGTELSSALCDRAAASLGLTAGIPVVMAPYDIVTTAYGAGVAKAGQACLILGTTICAETITDRLDLSVEPAGTTIALDGGLYLRAMPTLTGCETLEWAARLLNVVGIPDVESLASEALPGASGLLFMPYLSPAGERAPFLEPRASGSFHGLKLLHGRSEMARAVYEGLTFAIRECLHVAGAAVREIRVCGGGARSDLWCRMIADVTGLTVLRPPDNEVGARGAFLFGLTTVGHFQSIQAAVEALPSRLDRFTPDASRHVLYDALYSHFLTTREAQRALWVSKAGAI